MKTRKWRKGLTLIEIVVVLAIISLILSFAVPNMINARKRAQANTCVNNLKLLYEAGQVYRIDEGEAVSSIDVATLYGGGYIDAEANCPIGGAYASWEVDSVPTCSIGSQDLTVAWDDHIWAKDVNPSTGACVDWLKIVTAQKERENKKI